MSEDKLNVTYVRTKNGEIALEALQDQIVVLEDKFKTGYECKTCGGECYLEEVCQYCNGTGVEGLDNDAVLCRFCCPRILQESGSTQPGKKICPTCDGKGGLLIAPEVTQRRPSSGTITSIGYDVKHLKVDDKILYSQFAGTGIAFKQKDVVRIMHEHEAMCKIYGVGKVGEMIK